MPSNTVDNMIETVLLMRPPAKWWPLGVVGYPGDDNGVKACESGLIPDSSLVMQEFQQLTALLAGKAIPHVIMDFPSELDAEHYPPKGAYDAVFLRDCAVIAPSGTAYVPVRFKDNRRQSEAEYIWHKLDILGLQRLCQASDLPGAIEGGDSITGFLSTGEPYLFTGTQRNDERGSEFLREVLAVPKHNHVTIETRLCHIDSLMCVIGRSTTDGSALQSIILCPELINSGASELIRMLADNGLTQPIICSSSDTSADGGTLAINGITVGSPSGDYLITGAQFADQERIDREISYTSISHAFSPLTQYLLFSSGGVRCSTQVIRVPTN